MFYKITFCALFTAFAAGCSSIKIEERSKTPGPVTKYEKSFALPAQSAPPRFIQSIQLYREGSPANPPIIRLNSDETLLLEFDYLGGDARQFRTEVRHYGRDWDKSSINPEFYIDGFFEDYFSGGLKSLVQRPAYRHYQYEFPNSSFSITASGNYMLSVFDADTGEMLFNLPFFVTENRGELETDVRKVFAKRGDLREQDQLFSTFRYPGFVEFPQFDLNFVFVQNQFWGRSREAGAFDTSTPGIANFHLSRDKSFIGDYEFNVLDLRSFSVDGERIRSIDPSQTPVSIQLRRDIQNLSPLPELRPETRFGLPLNDRNAPYAAVHFRLETSQLPDTLSQIYLVGDFNNWMIASLNRMSFDAELGLWQGSALIKQGEYAYKYVRVADNEIFDLALDRGFTFSRQQYTTLVYFRDPARHYDRLLKADHIPE